MSRLRALFVMDPFETVLFDRDTTFVLMREAQARGHEVYTCLLSGLRRSGSGTQASVIAARTTDDAAEPIVPVGAPRDIVASDFDVIWMRKDPPFDMRYIFATYLLDGVDPQKTLVLNRPAGLREANEKCFILQFPSLIPETTVTMDPKQVYRFIEAQGGQCIVKPLDGMGGLGVFLLRSDDPNLSSLIETSTEFGRKFAMLQAYVPDARLGDKRIIMIDGEPVGATLRVPAEGELRGNIHVGATCVQAPLTARDREICETIAPTLRKHGLVFVGIDVLGHYLTEVNVTSPTGVQEINRLDDTCLEAVMWDWIEDQRRH